MNVIARFYELHNFIVKLKEKILLDKDAEKNLAGSEEYVNQLLLASKEAFDANEHIKEKFFYAMIGLYDHVMMNFLVTDLNIRPEWFDTFSLEVRFYKTAQFGEKLFDDINYAMRKYSNEKGLLKVYLNILNLLFSKNNQHKELRNQLYKVAYDQSDIVYNIPADFSVYQNSIVRAGRSIIRIDYSKIILFSLAALYCVSSTYIWFSTVNPIQTMIKNNESSYA